jgi:hypothetical protein
MKSLTICITTSRKEPEIRWIKDSLERQIGADEPDLLVINLHCKNPTFESDYFLPIRTHPPKPNIWQGEHRITKENWWAVSNARNTALCLCETEWICFIDDRCVLQAGFLDAIRSAMVGNYIMAGSYEKRHGMTVENGVIKNGGIVTGVDSRETYCRSNNFPMPFACGGEWMFGCCILIPLEWALQVNGWPEKRCDSLSFEDVIFGMLIQNSGFPIKFDPRAKIIEDRTPEKLGEPMKRTAKERWPHDKEDKAHKTLEWVKTAKRSDNDFEIRELRAAVQRGEPFPSVDTGKEHLDWFDNQPVKDF